MKKVQTEISVIIPSRYWGLVKRWLSKVARAPELLEEPLPTVYIDGDAIIYVTATGHGKYIIKANRTELLITFEGRRNSFRFGTPFFGFHWDGAYEAFGEVDVILKDLNPFAPEVVFLGLVESFSTSMPEMPFYKAPSEWVTTK
jgi:hypothetical protein